MLVRGDLAVGVDEGVDELQRGRLIARGQLPKQRERAYPELGGDVVVPIDRSDLLRERRDLGVESPVEGVELSAPAIRGLRLLDQEQDRVDVLADERLLAMMEATVDVADREQEVDDRGEWSGGFCEDLLIKTGPGPASKRGTGSRCS